MRIIFVRHGEPDYRRDCLTDVGRVQAAAAAERLAGEGIVEIYASPCGRARQTADFTARRLGLPVVELPYMREISWGGPGIPVEGHPWTLGDWLIAREDFDFYRDDWRGHPYFKENAATAHFEEISARIDGFLAAKGYRREGSRYRCVEGSDKTIALFSHGGSGACVLSHMLSLPFPYVASVMPYDFTSIIILSLENTPGACVFPRIELFNDCAHIHSDSHVVRLQEKSE